MNPEQAYQKAWKNGHTKKLEDIACQDPEYAYCFAKHIPEANIQKCQTASCKDPLYAYLFGTNIVNADIKYCANKIFVLHNLQVGRMFVKFCKPLHILILNNELHDNEMWLYLLNEYKIEKILS